MTEWTRQELNLNFDKEGLKSLCRKEGKKVSGNKDVLIDRLLGEEVAVERKMAPVRANDAARARRSRAKKKAEATTAAAVVVEDEVGTGTGVPATTIPPTVSYSSSSSRRRVHIFVLLPN